MNIKLDNTICALSTPNGKGAIALIRVTGKDTLKIVSSIFSKNLEQAEGNSIHFGKILEKKVPYKSSENSKLKDSDIRQNDIRPNDFIVDEVLISVFKNPKSYTGEDLVEISCHASSYIIHQILGLLLKNGCTAASAGEFTMRAFYNKKMDLSQAEAVADLIASNSAAAHRLAMQQMRGGFSQEIQKLREQLIHFASMIELELDFAEEDVEFADRTQFLNLIGELLLTVKKLADSFSYGNVIKNGIPVAIIGVPNVGKSTLLNAFLNENRALVSDIPGTTRDTVEDVLTINGVEFRFIDTAGLRDTHDVVEAMGIERTYKKILQSEILLYLVDAENIHREDLEKNIRAIQEKAGTNKKVFTIINKSDKLKDENALKKYLSGIEHLHLISARDNKGIEELKNHLYDFVKDNDFSNQEIIVTNARHYDALTKAYESLMQVKQGLETQLTGDLLAVDIRKTIFHLGEITGEISTDDLLGNIFSKFCIGK